jgi:hypothetical protein
MSALTDESCDIWELALDINNGDKQSALQMIEDQERLRSHPRVIEYYRAKEEDMDFEEDEKDNKDAIDIQTVLNEISKSVLTPAKVV